MRKTLEGWVVLVAGPGASCRHRGERASIISARDAVGPSSGRLRRSERMFAAIPGIWPSRSLNRYGPPSSASTTCGVHRSPTLASAGKRGRAVLLFSHERILTADVDSRAVVSSNLQVTSYWRHGSDDDP